MNPNFFDGQKFDGQIRLVNDYYDQTKELVAYAENNKIGGQDILISKPVSQEHMRRFIDAYKNLFESYDVERINYKEAINKIESRIKENKELGFYVKLNSEHTIKEDVEKTIRKASENFVFCYNNKINESRIFDKGDGAYLKGKSFGNEPKQVKFSDGLYH